MDNRSHRLLVTLIVAVMLAGSWVLGTRYGARQATANASTQMSSAQAQTIIDQLQVSLRETELALERSRLHSETAAARSEALQRRLDDQLRDNISSDRDLALYRRIETNERARAVAVESITWNSLKPSVLEVTLVQWQGRDRITGQFALSLNFGQAEGRGHNEVDEAKSGPFSVDLEPVVFDFRFFQKFSVSIDTEIVDDSSGKNSIQPPESVSVKIITADRRTKAVDELIPWSDIEQ